MLNVIAASSVEFYTAEEVCGTQFMHFDEARPQEIFAGTNKKSRRVNF